MGIEDGAIHPIAKKHQQAEQEHKQFLKQKKEDRVETGRLIDAGLIDTKAIPDDRAQELMDGTDRDNDKKRLQKLKGDSSKTEYRPTHTMNDSVDEL